MFGGMIMDINVKCVFVFIFFVIFVFPKLVKDQKIKTRNITTIVIIISAIINLFSFAIF